ncbi:MAG: choline-sulfatase [Chlamydiales bacterium]|jgi:choline-sulfatase
MGAAACAPSEQKPPLNVLLITLDTTRPDYMGTYGYESPTPGFDDIASQGIRFDRATSASSLTPVSHATILTGLYPDRHGVRVLSAPSGYRLATDEETLTTRLRSEGYRTAAVNSAFPVSSHFGFEHGFETWESMEGSLSETGAGWNVTKLQRRSDETTDVAITALAQLTEPFFLWVHYWDPHDRALLPPGDIDLTRETTDHVYGLEVAYVAQQFGRLCDDLRERGLWDRTVTVVTADHGQGLSDGKRNHKWEMHRMLYREQIRVPLLLRIPGATPGRVVSDVVTTADIAPTLYDLLGLEPVPDFDGHSLVPLIEGRPQPARSVYAEQLNGYDENAAMARKRPSAAFMYAQIEQDWKLIYRPHMPARSELFHLAKDPLELTNVFATEIEVRSRMLLQLARRAPWVLAPFPAIEGEATDVSDALAGLGYASADGPLDDAAWSWTCPRHLDARLNDPGVHQGCGAPLIPMRDE